jgi:hypothetical protein
LSFISFLSLQLNVTEHGTFVADRKTLNLPSK